jgi:hypothetical protein
MFIPNWLLRLQRGLLAHQARKPRNPAGCTSAHQKVQPCLEPLEERLTPSDGLNLTTGSIVPNMSNGTAQVALTAQVTNPGGVVNEGVVSFIIGSASERSNVVNGKASAQLTVPIQNVLSGFIVGLSYTDTAIPNNNASMLVATSLWNGLLPASLMFNASNNMQQVQFSLLNQPVFGASYSMTAGRLTQIDVGSSSVPVAYAHTGDSVVASVENVPWGVILYSRSGQFIGWASVALTSDGTPEWAINNVNNQLVAELPYF